MSKEVYRAAIYARLSRDDGDKEESNSITSQKAICMEYINTHKDLELVDAFVDDGYSGVSMNRPAYKNKMSELNASVKSQLLKINANSNKIKRLYEDYADGLLGKEEYFYAKGIYEKEHSELNNGLDMATKHRDELKNLMSGDNHWIRPTGERVGKDKKTF